MNACVRLDLLEPYKQGEAVIASAFHRYLWHIQSFYSFFHLATQNIFARH